jgi:ribonuclease-3
MAEPIVILRTHSDIEASVVKSLLGAHGITAMVSSDASHSVIPLAMEGRGEVRLSVGAEEADEARRLISGYRRDDEHGQLVRLRDEFEDLQAALGYRFRDRGLLEHALTHRSRANEDVTGGVADNESLEFLGDAILGFVIADLLFHRFPSYNEGQKSKLKSTLVSAPTLARLSDQLDLGPHLLLGRGEEKSGGRRKLALLADGYEALIAAIYLDGGIEEARSFLTREYSPLVDQLVESASTGQDHKSALQELLQARGQPLPEYRVTAEIGPAHHRQFRVALVLRGEVIATAEGHSKKAAEQEAARLAVEHLGGVSQSQ